MPKIILIEPRPPNLHIFSQFYTPRLGCFILGALMRGRGWEVEVVIEEMENIDFEAMRTADLVGISTITSTAPRAYAIADRLRSLGVKVMMGGPHVTFLTEEAMDHADFVVRGEGEKALVAFADAWENSRGLENVPNLSYWRDGAIRHNPMQAYADDLDTIPIPDLNLSKAFSRKIDGKVVIPVPGLPLRLLFLLGDGDVRPQVPLPFNGQRHDRTAPLRPPPPFHLFLRRQLRGQRRTHQGAAAGHDRGQV
jgi:hypothetical protein